MVSHGHLFKKLLFTSLLYAEGQVLISIFITNAT